MKWGRGKLGGIMETWQARRKGSSEGRRKDGRWEEKGQRKGKRGEEGDREKNRVREYELMEGGMERREAEVGRADRGKGAVIDHCLG